MTVRAETSSRRYPLHIWGLMGLAWACAFALILVSFLFCGLMLPLIPLFIAVVLGVSALLRSVYEFAEAHALPEASPARERAASSASKPGLQLSHAHRR